MVTVHNGSLKYQWTKKTSSCYTKCKQTPASDKQIFYSYPTTGNTLIIAKRKRTKWQAVEQWTTKHYTEN